MTQQNKINKLVEKLNFISKRQNDFSKEINSLRSEIEQLKSEEIAKQIQAEVQQNAQKPIEAPKEILKEKITSEPLEKEPVFENIVKPRQKTTKSPVEKSSLEKFIGENLINKIGILIIIFGVAIGAKYAIDNELISPLTRIILGYLTGLGLFGFAIKLKKKYEKFSAVLLSGAMAILYFISFFAYNLYELIPQELTFGLMFVITIFTVLSAINYNQKIIAIVGLVGAYAVPFLLSNNSGNVTFLFTYIAIINIGILAVSIKKNWKILYYLAFALTWIIFAFWAFSNYEYSTHLKIALVFSTLFYLIFYVTFMAYKIIKKEQFEIGNIMLLLSNSFIYFGLGYYILNDNKNTENYLGIFSVCNALVHFIIANYIQKKNLVDKNLRNIIIGLVLIFITLTIPIQLDGNWVTILWASEALLLFWLGRMKSISVYEILSYPLMILAIISLFDDWNYNYIKDFTPILNVNFLSNLLFIGAFGGIFYIKEKYKTQLNNKGFLNIFDFLLPIILIFTSYMLFCIEIDEYYNHSYNLYPEHSNTADLAFSAIWTINYSLFFFAILAFLNTKKIKNKILGIANIVILILCLLIFVGATNSSLNTLEYLYLNQIDADIFDRGIYLIAIRYISYGFITFSVFSLYQYVGKKFLNIDLKKPFEIFLSIIILFLLSIELISLLSRFGTESYKLELSILWGVYALVCIGIGIWKKKKHLRIGGMALFGLTLIKLFLYDISHLDTISKTIVFVALGILLLIISFLYNKYKHIISDEN